MRKLALLLAFLLLGFPPAAGAVRTLPPAPAAALQDDGPYVLWEGRKARIIQVRQGRLEEREWDPGRPLELPGLPPFRLDPAPPAPARAVFPMPRSLAAVSDVHGNCAALTRLLTAQGVIGPDRRWAFGKGTLLVLGDLFDRGAEVTEALWLVRSLEQQARAAGGAVRVLLGNHEVMALKGDLRYLNAKYRALPYAIPWLYGPETELGRWLRSLPVLVRVGDLLFLHGGIAPAFAAAHPDLQEVNDAARAELLHDSGPVLGGSGPLWYRGLIPGAGPEPSEAELGAILRTYGVKAIVVGHTTLDQVTAFRGARVYGIDAGLKDGRPGELWLQIGGKRFRGLADGTRLPLD